MISRTAKADASSKTLSNTIAISKMFIVFLFICFAVCDIIEIPPEGGREIALPLRLVIYRLS